MTYTDLMATEMGMRVRLCLKLRHDYTESMKNILLGAGIAGVLLIGGYILLNSTESKPVEKETPAPSNTKESTESKPSEKETSASFNTKESLNVSKFYDGSEGWSVSVPTGNQSICSWTYAGGSGAVPYIDTTRANTATEKHVLRFEYGMDFLYDFKVTCTDDFGDEYIGKFPI
ncbi:hypothetical protein EXS57_02405 [Candidatus Kaiserbacteria bacterium]|nr:hypothetical protein [Candidatus Kaiserbacteria bacterium]